MEIDNGIFVLSAMLIHRRFNVADISTLTSLSRSTVWRWIKAIPSVYPGTVIKSFDLPEYQLEQISPLFNEAGLHQYFELCLAQLASEKGVSEDTLPLAELGLTGDEPQSLSEESKTEERPQSQRAIVPPPGRRI